MPLLDQVQTGTGLMGVSYFRSPQFTREKTVKWSGGMVVVFYPITYVGVI
jgi:hypothetical protein